MSMLEQIRLSLRLRREAQTERVFRTIKQALGAVFYLRDNGCTVEAVEIRGDHAVITIDHPGAFMKGAVHVRRIHGDHRETVHVARVLDCQVQWSVIDQPELLRRMPA